MIALEMDAQMAAEPLFTSVWVAAFLRLCGPAQICLLDCLGSASV